MLQIREIVMKKFTAAIAALSVVAAAVCALMIANSNTVTAAAPVYVGQRTSAKAQLPMDDIDHSQWDRLLTKYVDDDGFVNYRTWHASSADRRALTDYLNHLSRANVKADTSRDAKLAFWINAYNAVTVHGILREYPTSSIRNHTAKVFGYNIWQDLKIVVGGHPYSLEDIEHQILRKMDEPRIHFAIVCASIGCPRLLNRAYTADHVQQQLELNAKDFFSRSQNLRYDQGNNRLYLSSILSWFADDFGSNQAAQLKMIAQWLPNQSARNAALRNSVTVSYLDYNWNLNDQATRR